LQFDYSFDGREIMWVEKVTYLGIYLVSSKRMNYNYDLSKKSFYRAFNVIYGKVGSLAPTEIVVNR